MILGGGEILLWVSGPIAAKSECGRIQAVLQAQHWHHAASSSTSTSDIEVHFPEPSDVDVRLETRGCVITDVSLAVEPLTSQLKRAHVRLGGGDEELLLRSERGNLRVALLLGPPERTQVKEGSR